MRVLSERKFQNSNTGTRILEYSLLTTMCMERQWPSSISKTGELIYIIITWPAADADIQQRNQYQDIVRVVIASLV